MGHFLPDLSRNTSERHQVLDVTQPIQSVLLMVFFLSVGLLIDIDFIIDHILKISLLLFIVAFGKTILNAGILRLLKQPWSVSFVSSLVLAQIGEFSFVLSDTASSVGLLSPVDHKLVITLTILSLANSPFWMSVARKFQSEDGSISLKRLRPNTHFQIIKNLFGKRRV